MRILIAAALLAAPAAASPPDSVKPYGPRAVLLPGDEACEAVIEVWNISGRYTGVETLPLEDGAASIRYETVGDHAPGNDDVVAVVGLPDGLHAEPMMAEVPDDAVLHICLFRYIGG